MSNELCNDFTAYRMAVQFFTKQLDELVAPTKAEEPPVPDILHSAVSILASDNPPAGSGPRSMYIEMVERVLQGAAARSIASGAFDNYTAARICEIRSALMSAPVSDTMQIGGLPVVPVGAEYTALSTELISIFAAEAQQRADAVRGRRKQYEADYQKFVDTRNKREYQLAEYTALLVFTASRLARKVLLGEVSVIDVMKTQKAAGTWNYFSRALTAESQWISAGENQAELETARAVVLAFNSDPIATAATTMGISIWNERMVCLGWLGLDGLADA